MAYPNDQVPAPADLAEAVFAQHEDGTVSFTWGPTDAPWTLASRALLEAVVARINGAPAEVERIRGALREIVATLGPEGTCECAHSALCGLPDEAADALRVARAALEGK